MNNLTFQMILRCNYTGDENDISQLTVEHLVDSDWHELTLSTDSPGFDIFLYAILTCQHMYFKNNAAEYGLVMNSSEGFITVIADEYRSIQSLHVDFKGMLKKGVANTEIINSIAARMDLCPVSINLKDFLDRKITVVFESS
jgi:uncharacterized OsmC-like protein